jgi:hypothetical protein
VVLVDAATQLALTTMQELVASSGDGCGRTSADLVNGNSLTLSVNRWTSITIDQHLKPEETVTVAKFLRPAKAGAEWLLDGNRSYRALLPSPASSPVP